MNDFETMLRQQLLAAAPAKVRTDGLAAGARARAARHTRIQRVAGAVLATVLLIVTVTFSQLGRPRAAVPARPLPAPTADCTRQAASISAAPKGGAMSTTARRAWICPTGSPGADATGWALPTTVLASQASNVWIGSASGDERCVGHRTGPSFSVTFESSGGDLSTYASSDLTCGGLTTLVSFLTARADEEVDRSTAMTAAGRGGCRSLPWLASPQSTPPVDLDMAQPFRQATLCLAPTWLRFDAVTHTSHYPESVRPREYASVPLNQNELALLNADLATFRSGFRGNGDCDVEGAWSYTIQGVTEDGTPHYLKTGCLDEFFRGDGLNRILGGFIPSAQTQSALRELVRRVDAGDQSGTYND